MLMLLLFRHRLVVGEEIELYGLIHLLFGQFLTDDAVDGDVQSTDQQDGVDDLVVELSDCLHDLR